MLRRANELRQVWALIALLCQLVEVLEADVRPRELVLLVGRRTREAALRQFAGERCIRRERECAGAGTFLLDTSKMPGQGCESALLLYPGFSSRPLHSS